MHWSMLFKLVLTCKSFADDSTMAQMLFRCPSSCWSRAYITDKKRCTILTSVQHTLSGGHI